MTLIELIIQAPDTAYRRMSVWWSERLEQHYLICADVENERAREAQMNASYYQKRAALARANRIIY